MKRWLMILLSLLLLVPTAAAEERERVRVAVIDTGVSTYVVNAANLDVGHNYLLPDRGTEDGYGHGTAVSAIIVGSKRMGITGICPQAVIVPLVWVWRDDTGVPVQGDVSVAARAIRDAVDLYHCRVINLSAGTALDDSALCQAVAYAEEQGALVVSCAGNDGSDSVYYPGGYDTVLCVGASNAAGTDLAAFSNAHAQVDLLAPGEELRVATHTGGTMMAEGTSYATASVSGAAALLLSRDPGLTPLQLRDILCQTARDIGPEGYDPQSGWGVLDLEAALARLENPSAALWDVSPEDYYHDAAHWAVEQGFLDADEGDLFDPDRPCTQGQVITSLWRASGASGGEEGAMAWAVDRGLLSGEEASAFAPEAICTRAKAVSLLHRLAGGVPAEHSRTLDDVPADAAYVDAVLWAYRRGITAGTGPTTFGPEEPCTRAQFATFLHRFFNGV